MVAQGAFPWTLLEVYVSTNSVVFCGKAVVSRLWASSDERDALLPLQKLLCLFVKNMDKIAHLSSSISGA